MDLSTVYSNFIKVVSATFIDDESEDGENGNEQKNSQSESPNLTEN